MSSLSRMFFLGFRNAPEIQHGGARKAGLALAAVFASVLALMTSTNAADLVIASTGSSKATIVLAPNAGPWEQRAATDLQKYIRLMSGAEPPIAAVAPEPTAPALYVGQAALATDPTLRTALEGLAKPSAAIRSDAIVVRRNKNRVMLAGSNDEFALFRRRVASE